MIDPTMQKQFIGVDGRAGFIYAWNGNKKAGAGQQEITKVTEHTSIDIQIRFIKPFKGIANAYMEGRTIFDPKTGQENTKVRWIFGSRLKYPMNIMLIFMNIDKTLGRDIQTSLQNLKHILEQSSTQNTVRKDLLTSEPQG